VRDIDNKVGLRKVLAGHDIAITCRGSQLFLGGKGIKGRNLILTAADKRQLPLFSLQGRHYRGNLNVRLGSAGLTVVNELPVDDYVAGVLPLEMSAAWPEEALKAQAVAARTFALYNKGRHAEDGYDVCMTTHCQVYGGADAEEANTTAAVQATRGEVLYAAGQPIDALFHTDSGGMTENSEDVWGTHYSYLRATAELQQKTMPWQAKYTAAEVQAKLSQAGHDIGTLQSIELTPLKIGCAAEDRGASGRVKIVRLVGTRGVATLSGNKMREIFKLKSTLFDISLENNELVSTNVAMGKKKNWTTSLPTKQETNFASEKAHRLSGQAAESIVISGYGWGHGLGLSQRGAKAWAAKENYRAILAHYYAGTELKKIY
jgi:stage II sporulation protein D